MNTRNRRGDVSLRRYEPFLKEYDTLLRYILTEVQHLQREIVAFKKAALILVASNRCLHRDLRRQVEVNLSSDPSCTNKLIKDLQSHLDIVLEEKNVTSKMLQTALQEIDHLENQLEEKKEYVDKETFLQNIKKVKVDYENKSARLEHELDETRNELFETHKSLHDAELRLARYSEPVCVIQNNLQEKEKELDEALQCLQQTQEKLILTQEEQTDTITRLAAVEAQLSKLKKEHANQLQDFKACQNRSQALQDQLSLTLEHAQEGVAVAEQALLEKQEAQLKSELLQNEIMELRKSLESVVEEAGHHTASEVEKFREKGNQHIRELIKRTGQLQQALQHEQSLAAQLSEENSRLRDELDRLQKIQADLRVNRDPAFQALSHTLMQAEKMCQKHRLAAESLRDELVQQEKQSAFKIKQGELENQRLHGLLQEVEKRADQLELLNIASEDQTAELRQKVCTLEAECTAVKRRHQIEVTTLTETLNQEKLMYNAKLQQVEDNFENKLMKTQALLQAQQTLTQKWKTEASKIASEFETELLAARRKMSALKKINVHLQKKAVRAARETHKGQGAQEQPALSV